MEFKANEISCYAEALTRTREAFGTLERLPPGALHTHGGLLPDTAATLEELIRSVVNGGNRDPSIPAIMAEIDQRIDYGPS